MNNKSNHQTTAPIPLLTISYFCTQISMMLKSGIALEDGIYAMRTETKSKSESQLYKQIEEGLSDHQSFSEVLTKTGAFPEYLLLMVHLGEETGSMETVLDELADYYESEYQIKQSIKNAVTYPVVMLIMMFLLLFVLSVKVMPVFQNVFAQLNLQIPAFAEWIIQAGGFISMAALLIIGIFLLAGILIWGLGRLNKTPAFIIKMKKRMFSGGGIAISAARYRTAKALSLSLASGNDLAQGLHSAAELSENPIYQKRILECSQKLSDGAAFGEAVRESQLFGSMQTQLLLIGQKTGRMDEVMNRIASECFEETDNHIAALLSRLEPSLVTALCVLVGGMLLLVMLPLSGIMNSLG